MKDPNCPMCHPEYGNWGGSPEYVEELRRGHFEKHCEKCPTCGQPITNPKEVKWG